MTNTSVVAITGSTGFIGSHILKLLLANNYRIKILVRSSKTTIIDHPNIEIIVGDLHNHDSLSQLTANADYVIHCAGRVRGASAAPFIHDNVTGTENILSACRQTRDCKFVLISSLSAREPTISDYANSKYESELALKQSQLTRWTIIRPPAVYGPGDTELKPIFDWMKRGILWVPGSAKQQFSLIHVSDLSQLIINQLDPASEPKLTIEPDDGNQYSWQEIKRICEEFFCRKIRIIRIPNTLLSLIAHSNVLFSKILNYSPMLTPGKVRELLYLNWVSKNASNSKDWQSKVDLKFGLGTLYSNNDVN